MLANIKISVIMASFNQASFLGEAIKSVLKQTYTNFELIIVDDNSTDNSFEIAKGIAALRDDIIVIRSDKTRGPAAARNMAIKIARGEWLAIMDADDISLPHRFEKQVEFIGKNPALIMVGSDAEFINEAGEIIFVKKFNSKHNNLVNKLLSSRAFPPHSSIMYRKDIIVKVGGFNERFIRSQDYNLWHRMIECGPIGSVEIVLVQIRKHAGNISLDDKGYLQFKFSVIASTCHFIKSRCGFDPADSKDDKTWQDFLAWVDNRIKMTGIFFNLKSYLNFTANLRTFSFRKILWSFFDLSAILNIFRFITSKVFKKTVGSSLADEWLEKNGHVSGNKISVIMACYNSSDFIEEAINSILEQDFQDFELILIDDCSKDDTFKIITKFKKLDSRIKVAQTKINSGPAVARNIGISLSVYDWIAILDSDDLSMVGRLKDQIKIGVSDRKIVLVGCDAEFFDGSSQINYKYPASSNRMKARLLNGRAFQPHSSMLYRKSALNRVGGFNKRYLQSEDYNLWCRLALLGKFSSVRKPLVRIRKHLNNISLAEGGHKQILYRFLAAISFDLKKELFIDTDYYSDEEWNDFLIWEKERLEFYGFFKYWDKFISAKINIKKSGGLIIGFKYLLFDINFIYLFIVNYFFDRTRKKIAKEWVAHKYRVEQRI